MRESTDQDGNLYVADCSAGRVPKFAPQPEADPDKWLGQIQGYTVAHQPIVARWEQVRRL